MNVSVALCTYNGERFLGAQLDSLLRQEVLPTELVVSDDCSVDGTLSLLQEFARRAPFPVRIEQNSRTLGVTGNYAKAISRCTGEAIALADQDDVWLPGRLGKAISLFEGNTDVGLVFSDATVSDDNLRPLGYGLWESVRFTRAEQARVESGDAIPVLLKHQVVTGATLTFRARYLPLILPIPQRWIHDGWIAFLIGATSLLGLIREPLILYRQHARNQIGGRRLGWLELVARAERNRSIQNLTLDRLRFLDGADRLGACDVPLRNAGTLRLIAQAVHHLGTRAGLPTARVPRLPLIARELFSGDYRRYSLGIVSAVQDFIL